MSQKTLKKLVLALVVASALWGIVTVYPSDERAADASSELVAFLEGVGEEASIHAVRLRPPAGDTVELTRTDGSWTVNEFPTDSSRVAQLFEVLSSAEVRELVSRNAANHGRMGVADGDTHTIEVDAEGYAGAMVLGEAGARYGTTYVRVPGEDEVYLLEGNLSVHARRSHDDWRSKRVVALDTASIERIDVSRDGSTYSLSRGDSAWTFEDGSETNEATVRNILSELGDLRAAGFLSEGDSVAGLPAGGSVVAVAADGTTLASIELGSGEGERWVRRLGDAVIYRMGSYRIDRVAPVRERLEPGA
jgi:hypothetical protein